MYYNIVILTYLLISLLDTQNGNNECIVTMLLWKVVSLCQSQVDAAVISAAISLSSDNSLSARKTDSSLLAAHTDKAFI